MGRRPGGMPGAHPARMGQYRERCDIAGVDVLGEGVDRTLRLGAAAIKSTGSTPKCQIGRSQRIAPAEAIAPRLRRRVELRRNPF